MKEWSEFEGMGPGQWPPDLVPQNLWVQYPGPLAQSGPADAHPPPDEGGPLCRRGLRPFERRDT
jgi:hypothetical protein